MDHLLFIFVISGALAHVYWNILLKQSKDKITFSRWFTLSASILLVPLLFVLDPLPKEAWPFFITTVIIHVFYKIFLCKVYDHSGLSYGYPIARGAPSLILLFLTPFYLNDSHSGLEQISILLIASGILLLIFSDGKFKKINVKGLINSFIVAGIIVLYSLNDAKGARLSNAFIYLFYYFMVDGFVFNLVSYFVFKKSKLELSFFKKHYFKIVTSGMASVYSYLTAVYGFTVGKVAVIAALRESSILFASIYGIYFLKEKGGFLRLFSAFLIVFGCILVKIFG